MRGQQMVSLKSLSEKITKGTTPTSLGSSFTDFGINFIKAESYTDYGIFNPKKFAFINRETHDKLKRSKLQKDDVIISIAGVLGRCAIVTDSILPANTNQAVGIIRIDRNKALPQFIRYYLTSPSIRAYINQLNGQAAQPNINLTQLGGLKIPLPSLLIQKKIAAILGAYDDLIENNLKRIKLLEEKAQLTYEEWFVRMKFPGHETTSIDKETGLPEGWRKGKLAELIGYQSGFAYKSAKFTDEGFPVIKIKNIDNNTIDTSNTNFIDKEYALQTDKFKLNEGDLLIAMTGATVGKVGIVPITKAPCYLNQRVGRFLKIGKVDNTSFVNNFFSIGGGLNHVLNIAGGAAQPNISAKQILSIDSIIPQFEILERFSVMAISSTKENLNLQKQNQLLKEARDILLPRLMTGMIDVEQLNLETLQPTNA